MAPSRTRQAQTNFAVRLGGRRQCRQHGVSFALEHIVSAERNHVPGRQDVVDAAFHQPANVEIVIVQEGRNGNTKDVAACDLLPGRGGKSERG
jgi:hypothetical protein